MQALALAFSPRFVALTLCLLLTLALLALGRRLDRAALGMVPLAGVVLFGGLTLLGVHDLVQDRHAVLRNYPISAHLRFLLEEIRPEMRQYFFESETDGLPFSRTQRAIVYQRAKMALDKRPFGTQLDVYAQGYEWLRHSIAPKPVRTEPFRITVGGPDCRQPYSASVFNISAMSFGALSANAIRALNSGAALGGFAHDTGEGGYSPYHREGGGDVIWEIGSGYFGCRRPDGGFDPDKFAAAAANPQIKMIEIKLSQGAKPGHGGVLPGGQGQRGNRRNPRRRDRQGLHLAREPQRLLDAARNDGVSSRSCASSAAASRSASSSASAIPGNSSGSARRCWRPAIYPDFIVVDGKEGGTGAAPLEFTDHLGMPLREGLVFVRNALIGIGLRDRIRIGCSGKIVTAFDMAAAFALGADWCNSARGFMFALGCIQSLSCHTDRCPTGVATQDKTRGRALVVEDKTERVRNFHRSMLHALAELTAAAGLEHPSDFHPEHFSRRVTEREVLSFAELYPALESGELVAGARDPAWRKLWEMARADSFAIAM